MALQLAGKTAIIQEEGGNEIGIVPVQKFYITDGIAIRVRVGELIHSDNGLGFHPHLIIPESDNRNNAIEKAREMLKQGIQLYNSEMKNFSGFTSNYNRKSLTTNYYPTVGDRVLAAAKIYSVLKHFYPNQHLWTHNWDSVYLHFLPRFVLAADSIEYVRAVMELYTHVQDRHGQITHPLVRVIRGFLLVYLLSPPFGLESLKTN